MKRFWVALPLIVFAILGAFFYKGLSLDPRAIPTVLIDHPVEPMTLPAIPEMPGGFSTEDLKGKVTLVNIFGSWCVSCRIEHPFLMQLKETDAVPIYGIDWREKDPQDGTNWLKRFGNPYTLIGEDPDSKAAIAFGVTGAPETFVVDKNAVIRYKHTGPVTPEAWRDTLLPLVEELRKQ